ncbi:MAG: AraC family transcriptional regulator ligand-binding domain-containing protein, partial [Vibrio sp.]
NFMEYMTSLGENPIELLDLAGIIPSQIRDPDNMILYSKVGDLLELAALRLADPLLGLKVSLPQGLSTVGLIGAYMTQQANIEQALQTAQRYSYMHAQGALLDLKVHSTQSCELQLDMLVNDNRQYPHLVQTSIGLVHNMLRDLISNNWQASKVTLTQKGDTALSQQMSALLHCPVELNQDSDSIYFSPKVLTLTPAQPNNLLNHIVERLFQQQQSSPQFDHIALIKHAIHMLLPTGDCSKENIAKSLGIHPKKLQRQLQSHNTSYRDLLAQCRKEIALRTLTMSDMSLSHLALNLGYSEFSAFSRAFKTWFGVAPSDFEIK